MSGSFSPSTIERLHEIMEDMVANDFGKMSRAVQRCAAKAPPGVEYAPFHDGNSKFCLLSIGSGSLQAEIPFAEAGVPVIALEWDPIKTKFGVMDVLRREEAQLLEPGMALQEHGDLMLLRPEHVKDLLPEYPSIVIYVDSEGMTADNIEHIKNLAKHLAGRVAGIIIGEDLRGDEIFKHLHTIKGMKRKGSKQKTSMYAFTLRKVVQTGPAELIVVLPKDRKLPVLTPSTESYFGGAATRKHDYAWSANYNFTLLRHLTAVIPTGTHAFATSISSL
jgi:hypothetical protein